MSDTAELPKRIFDHTNGVTRIDCDLHCPANELGEEHPHYRYDVSPTGPQCKIGPRKYEAAPRTRIKRILPPYRDLRICVYWDEILSAKF